MVNEQEFQNHLSNLIDLVTDRSQGKLDEERVEAAVSHLLDKAAAETKSSSNNASAASSTNRAKESEKNAHPYARTKRLLNYNYTYRILIFTLANAFKRESFRYTV